MLGEQLVGGGADDVVSRKRGPAHSSSFGLIGIKEIADEFGFSRQRAGKLADAPDFPAPVAHIASGRIYTRASVKAFQQCWEATCSPLGGRPCRQIASTTKKAKTPS